MHLASQLGCLQLRVSFLLDVIVDNLYLFLFGTIFLAISLLLMRVHRGVPGIRELSLSGILFTVGLVCFIAETPPLYFWAKTVAANILLVYSAVAQLFGFSRLFNKAVSNTAYSSFAVVVVMLFLFATFVHDSFQMRLVIINGALAIFFLRALALYLMAIDKWGRISQVFVLPAMGLLVMIFITRLLHGLSIAPLDLVSFTNYLVVNESLLIVLLLIVSYYVLAAEYQANHLRLLSDVLESRVQFKSNIIRFLNHELKTPLNAVLLKLEMLKDQTHDSELQRDLGFLEDVSRDILHTTQAFLTKDVFEKSSGVMRTNLRQAIQETLTLPSLLAKRKNLSLIFQIKGEVPDSLLLNQTVLQIVLLNLVSNAIKYTPSNGEVAVLLKRMDASQIGEITLRLSVSDTGVGLSADDLERIYEPFWRSSKTEREEGNGLGLVIVKELLTTIDSSLEIESKEGEGTCVSFIFKGMQL